MHYFSSKKNSIAGKGRYRTGRGVLVFDAGLGICSWLKKKENIHVLFIFSKIFLAAIFLVIGVKPGKSSGMGEHI
jgi:hypothetical protein